MTTYQNNRGEKWLLVPVPDDAGHFVVEDFPIHHRNLWFYNSDGVQALHRKSPIPLSMELNYTLICTSDEITEEQAKAIVETVQAENHMGGFDTCFKEYIRDKWGLETALESFHSLLHSLNLSRVVVLKIEE